MKTNSNQFSHGVRVLIGVALCVAVTAAWGSVMTPLYVGNSVAVLDEYGRPMMGSSQVSDATNRPRLEIRTSTDDIIRPPSVTGAPHPYNPLLTEDSVGGMGMNTSSSDSGLFCLVLSNRPSVGTKIFGRAFNAPTLEESSFYADSLMTDAPASGSSVVLSFRAAEPLDDGDDDGDGLNNSWEKAMGTDGTNGVAFDDYDGDGMLDLHEMLAGTGGNDSESLLAFRTIAPDDSPEPLGGEGSKPVRIRWQSIPGKQYQLQYVPTLLGIQNFLPVPEVGDTNGIITAAEGEYEIDLLVEIPEGATVGAFRVRLVHGE